MEKVVGSLDELARGDGLDLQLSDYQRGVDFTTQNLFNVCATRRAT